MPRLTRRDYQLLGTIAHLERQELLFAPARRSAALQRLCEIGLVVFVCFCEVEDRRGGHEVPGYALTGRGRYEERWRRGAWVPVNEDAPFSGKMVLIDKKGTPVLLEVSAGLSFEETLRELNAHVQVPVVLGGRLSAPPTDRQSVDGKVYRALLPRPGGNSEHLRTRIPRPAVETMILRGALSEIARHADTTAGGTHGMRGRLNAIHAIASAFPLNNGFPASRGRT